MQNLISFLMVFIFFENFEKTFFVVRRGKFPLETLTITNFERFSLVGVDTLTIKIQNKKSLGARGVLLNFNLQIIFIIYQKSPFKGRIVPGRIHSEVCVWGVKSV